MRGARIVGCRLAVGIQDRLVREHVIVINVDEGLMEGVIGEEMSPHLDPRGPVAFNYKGEAQTLSFGEGLDGAPDEPHVSPVKGQREPRGKQPDQCVAGTGGDDWILQILRQDVRQVRGGVEVVHDESARDAPSVEVNVEIAERNRMRGGKGSADQERADHKKAEDGAAGHGRRVYETRTAAHRLKFASRPC